MFAPTTNHNKPQTLSHITTEGRLASLAKILSTGCGL
jgi:hypothetical protein